MSGLSRPPQPAADDETIAAIESALHSLARRLKQARLHDFVLRQAGADIDQAGLAIRYALPAEKASLRVTDLAERLASMPPRSPARPSGSSVLAWSAGAVTPTTPRACRLGLGDRGKEAIERFLFARHEWLTMLLADWPPAERCGFARLISRFAGDIHRHLDELDI
jgi:hypothetical protein